MRIDKLKKLKLGILGIGLEGRASLDFLRRRGLGKSIAVFADQLPDREVDAELFVGEKGLAELPELDLLLRSPGFAPHHVYRKAADRLGLAQSTASNLFISELRAAGLPVVGITGSKGKSTVSALSHLILQEASVSSYLVGNIGEPALARLDEILAQRAPTIMELSSYQCADLQPEFGPTLACMLALFPEHLDWHGGTAEYYAAKFNLAATQRSQDGLIIDQATLAMNPGGAPPAGDVEIVPSVTGLHFRDGQFLEGSAPFASDNAMQISGVHNRQNALAAFAIARRFGAQSKHFQQALEKFSGLPHRLQKLGCYAGVHWVNDAISTTPDSSIAAVNSFAQAGGCLILGGFDRGLDQRALVDFLAQSCLQSIVLLPDTGHRLAGSLRQAIPDKHVVLVHTLAEAVDAARKHTRPGAYCLYSPGAPSFNQFASYQERGEAFTALVRAGS